MVAIMYIPLRCYCMQYMHNNAIDNAKLAFRCANCSTGAICRHTQVMFGHQSLVIDGIKRFLVVQIVLCLYTYILRYLNRLLQIICMLCRSVILLYGTKDMVDLV